jgi:hypothetical protein
MACQAPDFAGGVACGFNGTIVACSIDLADLPKADP